VDYVDESKSIMMHNQSVKVPCGPRQHGPLKLILWQQ